MGQGRRPRGRGMDHVQALDLLCRDAQHQPDALVFRADLHRHHPLLGSDRHGGKHLGRRAHAGTRSAGLALLQAPDEPGQQRHHGDEQDDDDQGLRHAGARSGVIHGSRGAAAPKA